MRLSKWHALGNSYLLLERADLPEPLSAERARELCAGESDGLLEITSADGASAEVVIWNPDGSQAELSGNGTRIAARWLAERSGLAHVTIRVGGREVDARVRGGGEVATELGGVEVGETETIDVGDERVELTPVSVGNPHAVIRREPHREDLLRLGPLVERHPRFPERTNVQLVRIDAPQELTVRVWERGAGETAASGTSAVAAAAAAVANRWCDSPIVVHLPGGDLHVELDGEMRARLTGPAERLWEREV
jgi:diaminopimelate epimerase